MRIEHDGGQGSGAAAGGSRGLEDDGAGGEPADKLGERSKLLSYTSIHVAET